MLMLVALTSTYSDAYATDVYLTLVFTLIQFLAPRSLCACEWLVRIPFL